MHPIRSALSSVLTEIRNISAGLSLPQLNGASLSETVLSAVGLHEEYSGTKVLVSIEDVPTAVSHALKICIYRFVQEALTNASRHARGLGQRVTVKGTDPLCVVVADSGPGFDPNQTTAGLGLTGMRARIETIGGNMTISSSRENGTELVATFPARSLDVTDRNNG